MDRRPIRFFLPSARAEAQVQTSGLMSPRGAAISIIDRMRGASIASIVSPAGRPPEVAHLHRYSTRLQFFLANMRDQRFDPLTPPADLFSDDPVGLRVEFHGDRFVMVGQSRPVTFRYDRTVIPVLESLESGIVHRELLGVLARLDVDAWENGCVLCGLVDFRADEPVEHARVLRLSAEVAAGAADLAAERDIAMLMRPGVCVDASPDVARAASVLDRRRKAWARRRRLEARDLIVSGRPEVDVAIPVKVTLCPLVGSVVIPDAVFAALAESGPPEPQQAQGAPPGAPAF